MRRMTLLFGGLTALALAAVGPGQEKRGPVAELPKVTGVWDVVGGEIEGQRLDERKLEGTRVVFEGDKLRLSGKNASLNFIAKFTLDTAKTPTVITMTVTDGPRQGQVAHGIVDMDS